MVLHLFGRRADKDHKVCLNLSPAIHSNSALSTSSIRTEACSHGWLQECVTCEVVQASSLEELCAVTFWKFLIVFDQGTPALWFCSGPSNLCSWSSLQLTTLAILKKWFTVLLGSFIWPGFLQMQTLWAYSRSTELKSPFKKLPWQFNAP